jgi:uncharacterized protein
VTTVAALPMLSLCSRSKGSSRSTAALRSKRKIRAPILPRGRRRGRKEGVERLERLEHFERNSRENTLAKTNEAKQFVSRQIACYSSFMNWQANLIHDSDQIGALIRETKRIAVLGIKTEAQSDQPSVYVPLYMQKAGYEIVPVPVYYPDASEILGQKVYRRIQDIPGEIDMVDVFRRPPDINGHVEDILAKKPKSVWFQLGIRNDAAAEIFAKAGVKVVQDR